MEGNGLENGEEEESGDELGSGGQVEKELMQQQVDETKVEVPEDPTTVKLVHQKRTL